jgi:ABC-type multidrug transport system ATPase subunit
MPTPVSDAPDGIRIRCTGLSKTFVLPGTRIEALTDITFDVHRGEVFGLLGQNGVGKTTLMRLVATILRPTRGTAMVGGSDVTTHPRQARSIIGLMTGDERSFYGRLSGRHNLDLFAALCGLRRRARRRRIEELFDLFELQRHADIPFQAFSSGAKQRLNMARALLHDPEVLLLDEPTRSMDIGMAEKVHRLVGEELVGRQHKTVLLTSHDTREIETLCGRVGIVKEGRIIASGRPRELAAPDDAQVGYVLEVSGGSGDEDFAWLDQVAGLGVLSSHRQRNGLTVVRVRVEDGQEDPMPEVWRRLGQAGYEVARCVCETHSVRQVLARLAELDAETEAPE